VGREGGGRSRTALAESEGDVGYSPTSEIDGGGVQHKRWGQSSLIRLVFWVELGPGPIVVGSGRPRPGGALVRRYSGPGRIPLCHSNK
jgi:hypothetical protein